MKPCRGPLSPANYVETSKTIKHLVVFLPCFNFSQYCDRAKYCAFPRVVAVKRSKSKGQGRANRWIYNFLFIYSLPIVSVEVFLQGCILRSLFSLHSSWIPFSPPIKKKNTTQTARPSMIPCCWWSFLSPRSIQEFKSKIYHDSPDSS